MNTVKQLDSGRNNNFDLIRFIAASLVIFSHSFLVTGNFKNEPLLKHIGFLDFGALGVKVFFAISGYLITKSILRQPSLNNFVWARFLRIFPGLFIAAVFCAFVIGPACTVLPLNAYFANKAVYDFVWQLATLHHYGNSLPGTFLKTPYPLSVNSPVWTLTAELIMYLCVLIGGILLAISKKRFKELLITLPVILIVACFYWGLSYPLWYMGYILSWGVLFALGACCYLFSNKIIINIPLLFALLIIFCLFFHFRLPFVEYVFNLLLMYGILIFSYHPWLQFKAFHKLGDYSYGLYIYAFPIQQLLIFKYPALTTTGHFALSFLLTLLLAIPSWHFIEKPLLSLKNRRFMPHE